MHPLGGGRFAVTVIWRIAAFVIILFFVPAIAAAIQSFTKCAGSGGACLAVSVATGTLLRPLLLVVLALSLVRPCWRRVGTLEMHAVGGLLPPLLLLADWRSLSTSSLWSPNFGIGFLNSGLPFFAILALAIILLLIVAARPAFPGDTPWRRHGIIGMIGWVGAVAAVVLGIAWNGLYVAWAASFASAGFQSPYLRLAIQVGKVASIVCLVAAAAFLWMILAEIFRRPRRRREDARG